MFSYIKQIISDFLATKESFLIVSAAKPQFNRKKLP